MMIFFKKLVMSITLGGKSIDQLRFNPLTRYLKPTLALDKDLEFFGKYGQMVSIFPQQSFGCPLELLIYDI